MSREMFGCLQHIFVEQRSSPNAMALLDLQFTACRSDEILIKSQINSQSRHPKMNMKKQNFCTTTCLVNLRHLQRCSNFNSPHFVGVRFLFDFPQKKTSNQLKLIYYSYFTRLASKKIHTELGEKRRNDQNYNKTHQ